MVVDCLTNVTTGFSRENIILKAKPRLHLWLDSAMLQSCSFCPIFFYFSFSGKQDAITAAHKVSVILLRMTNDHAPTLPLPSLIKTNNSLDDDFLDLNSQPRPADKDHFVHTYYLTRAVVTLETGQLLLQLCQSNCYVSQRRYLIYTRTRTSPQSSRGGTALWSHATFRGSIHC